MGWYNQGKGGITTNKKTYALKAIYRLTKGNVHRFATPEDIEATCSFCDRQYLYLLEKEGLVVSTYHPGEDGYTLLPAGEEFIKNQAENTFMKWLTVISVIASIGALVFSALTYWQS